MVLVRPQSPKGERSLAPQEDTLAEPQKPTVVVVAGPTASGKSGLGLALAQDLRRGGDQCRCHAGLSRPGNSDRTAFRRRPGGGAPSALRHPRRARGLLRRPLVRSGAARDRGGLGGRARQPILVGGTGLYLKALREGLTPLPEVPAAVRAAAVARFEALGGPAFREELAARDPETAAKLHPNDRQRLIRAWEVLEASGRGLAAWRAEQAATAGAGEPLPFRDSGDPAVPRAGLCQLRCALPQDAGGKGPWKRSKRSSAGTYPRICR